MIEDLLLVAPRSEVRDGHTVLDKQPVTEDVLLADRFVLQQDLDAQQAPVALVKREVDRRLRPVISEALAGRRGER